MRVLVITPPQPVVTLQEAKDHLKIRSDDENALIISRVKAATQHIDGYESWLGRSIGPQTLEARFDNGCIPYGVRLPCPTIIDVLSVKFLDSDRVEQTVDPADYELIDRTVYPIASTAPWASARNGAETLRIRYRAGFAANPAADPLVADVPEDIKAAILLMTGDLFANRETAVTGTISSAVPMSTTVKWLLESYRVYL